MSNTLNTRDKNIRQKLGIASATLLQVSPVAAADYGWDFDTAILYYEESDGRVSAVEPVISGTKELSDDEKINIKIVLDSLTGATPNGAHASSVEQTFTTPSGKKSYTTKAGDTPLDDTFLDTRVALSGSYEFPFWDDYSRMILNGNFSTEYDYSSLGLAASFLRDFNSRNTTLSVAFGLNFDTIEPEGNIPTPLAYMRVADSGTNREGSDDDKTITDIMFGITQVISRTTLMQFNIGLSNTDGYMNDPFKVLTVVDSETGLPGTPADSNDLPYLYESRPDTRDREIFFWKVVHHLTEDVINLSYRYHTDDWGIDSHTVDFHYRYELGDGSYLQPHLRYYTQSEADFFTNSLVEGEALPAYASADYRLGKFETNTIGLKYATPVGKDSEFSVRGEVINQVQSDVGDDIGDQQNHDLVPDLDSFIIQLGYSFHF